MAGGASSRFGMDKALAELGGQIMLERMCSLLGELTDDVSVVAPAGRYGDLGQHIVEDNWPGQGPLGGIITALMDTHARKHTQAWCLIVGCDMPFLTREWLRYLVERAFASGGGVVAPRSELGLEPLCACWHTRAVARLQYALEDGVRKVTEAMKRIETEVVDEKDWKRFDSRGRLFWNMNSPADYEETQRILKGEQG
jgi:molybdopterin-guanine dinucleotide biosynthesis protein A